MEYATNFYSNNSLDRSVTGLTASDAYNICVTKNMVTPDNKNRWHIMMKNLAIPRLSTLFVGETIRIAWQSEVIEMEQKYILIQRTK